MAQIDLNFLDHNLDGDSIKVEQIDDLISIRGISFGDDFVVELDKSTAIKFAKTLRTEINKIQD